MSVLYSRLASTVPKPGREALLQGTPAAPRQSDEPDGMPAAVGQLLVFGDAGHERAFAHQFHTSHRSNDVFFIGMGAGVNLLALTLPLRQGLWWPVCFTLFESAVLAAAALLASKAPARYVRWRTAIVAAIYSLHVLCSETLSPSVASPGCRGHLGFWLQELNTNLSPWIALISLSTPLLLKHAVLAQAAVVATTLACSRARQRLSFALCQLSGERYVQAARLLSAVAACILPQPLGAWLLDYQRQHLQDGPAAFHAVQTAVLLNVAYCAVLWRLAGVERRMRAAYARRQRAAAEAQGLAAYRRCWLGSTAVLLTAVLWALSCRAAVLLA